MVESCQIVFFHFSFFLNVYIRAHDSNFIKIIIVFQLNFGIFYFDHPDNSQSKFEIGCGISEQGGLRITLIHGFRFP